MSPPPAAIGGSAGRLAAAGLTATTVLWLVAGLSMLQPLSTDLYLPALPAIAKAFAADVATVQSTLWLFIAVFGFWQLVAGPVSDRYGRAPVIVAGVVMYCVASLACMLAPSIAWLIAGRIGQAIGACTCLVGARAVVRDLYTPADSARLLAGAATIMGFAPLIGPLVGALLLTTFGWRSSFALLAAFSFALAIFAATRLRETHAQRSVDALSFAPVLRNYRRIAGSRTFRAYTLAAAASYAGLFAFISGSSFVLMQVLGMTATGFALSFSMMVAGYLAGTVLCRRLVTTHGVQRTVVIGASVQAVAGSALALGAVAAWHSPLAITVPMMVFGLSHGLVQPPSQAGAVAPFPQAAGAAAALMGFVMMAVAASVGVWIGVSYDASVYPLTFTIFGCALASAAIAYTLVLRDGNVAHHG
jgi:MFS transporter, DHA1 family, multidrug resistance protein